jgi:hypothetical protein
MENADASLPQPRSISTHSSSSMTRKSNSTGTGNDASKNL